MVIRLFGVGMGIGEYNPYNVEVKDVEKEDIQRINVKMYGFNECVTLYLKNGKTIEINPSMDERYNSEFKKEYPTYEYELLTPEARDYWFIFNQLLEGTEYNRNTYNSCWALDRYLAFIDFAKKGASRHIKFFNDVYTFVFKNGETATSDEFGADFGSYLKKIYEGTLTEKEKTLYEKQKNTKKYVDEEIRLEMVGKTSGIAPLIENYNNKAKDGYQIVEVFVRKNNGDEQEKIYG